MLSDNDKNIISNYVNEYNSVIGIDLVYINHDRQFEEKPDSIVIVRDLDFLIDKNNEYEILLKHPVEDNCFIPLSIDYYEIEIALRLDRSCGLEIKEIIDTGVVDSISYSLLDPEITDDFIESLVSSMCFDAKYQKEFTEVKDLIQEFYSVNQSNYQEEFTKVKDLIQEFEKIKLKLKPYLFKGI